MNYASAYVIGLTPYNLLKIDYRAYADEKCLKFVERIGRIKHGHFKICDATLIPDLNIAKDMITDIRLRHAIIEGAESIDLSKLHIYEANIGMEVT